MKRTREELEKQFEYMGGAPYPKIVFGYDDMPFYEYAVKHHLSLTDEEIEEITGEVDRLAEEMWETTVERMKEFREGDIFELINLENDVDITRDIERWNSAFRSDLERRKRYLLAELREVRAALKEYQTKEEAATD